MLIEQMRAEMATALGELETAQLGLEVTDRAARPIRLTKHEAAPEPICLRRPRPRSGGAGAPSP